MSAQLATSNSFSAHLALAAGVSVSINAPTLADLQQVVGKLQPAAAANDSPAKAAPKPEAPKTEAKAAPKPEAPKTEAKADTGNAPASTPATPAGAPAANAGSEAAAGDTPRPTYDDVKARVLALAKISRTTATDVLGQFKTVAGGIVDHGNKLQLEDYPAFLAAADKLIAGGAGA